MIHWSSKFFNFLQSVQTHQTPLCWAACTSSSVTSTQSSSVTDRCDFSLPVSPGHSIEQRVESPSGCGPPIAVRFMFGPPPIHIHSRPYIGFGTALILYLVNEPSWLENLLPRLMYQVAPYCMPRVKMAWHNKLNSILTQYIGDELMLHSESYWMNPWKPNCFH